MLSLWTVLQFPLRNLYFIAAVGLLCTNRKTLAGNINIANDLNGWQNRKIQNKPDRTYFQMPQF